MFNIFKPIYEDDVNETLRYDNKYRKGQKFFFYILASFIFLFNLALFNTPLNAYSNNDAIQIEDFSAFKTIDKCDYSLTATKDKGVYKDGEKNLSCITLNNVGNLGNNFSYIKSNDFLNEVKYYTWQDSQDLTTGNIYYYSDWRKGDGDWLLESDTYNGDKIYSKNEYTYLKDKGHFDFFTMYKFIPSWIKDGSTRYELASKGKVYYDVGTNPNDAYYRYDTDGNLIKYNKYSDIKSVKVDYLYDKGKQNADFIGYKPSNYDHEYVTLESVRKPGYNLEHYEEEYKNIDYNGKAYGTQGFNSASYFKGNTLFLWDEGEHVFYTYRLFDAVNAGYVTESQAQKLKQAGETIIEHDTGINVGKLKTSMKRYFSFNEKYWDLSSYEDPTQHGFTNNTSLPSSSNKDTFIYYDVHKDKVTYEAYYNYYFTYVSKKMYQYTDFYDRYNYHYTKSSEKKGDNYKRDITYSIRYDGNEDGLSRPYNYENDLSNVGSTLEGKTGKKYSTQRGLGLYNWSAKLFYSRWTMGSATHFSNSDRNSTFNTSTGKAESLTFKSVTDTGKTIKIGSTEYKLLLGSDNNYYYDTGYDFKKMNEKYSLNSKNINSEYVGQVTENTSLVYSSGAENPGVPTSAYDKRNISYNEAYNLAYKNASDIYVYDSPSVSKKKINYYTTYPTKYRRADYQNETITTSKYDTTSVSSALSRGLSSFKTGGNVDHTEYSYTYRYYPKFRLIKTHNNRPGDTSGYGADKEQYWAAPISCVGTGTPTTGSHSTVWPSKEFNVETQSMIKDNWWIRISASQYNSGNFAFRNAYGPSEHIPTCSSKNGWGQNEWTAVVDTKTANNHFYDGYSYQESNYDGKNLLSGDQNITTTSYYGTFTDYYYANDCYYSSIYNSSTTYYKYYNYTITTFSNVESSNYSIGSKGRYNDDNYYVYEVNPKYDNFSSAYWTYTWNKYRVYDEAGTSENKYTGSYAVWCDSSNYSYPYKMFYYNSSGTVLENTNSVYYGNVTSDYINKIPGGYTMRSSTLKDTDAPYLFYSNCYDDTRSCTFTEKQYRYEYAQTFDVYKNVYLSTADPLMLSENQLNKMDGTTVANTIKANERNIIKDVSYSNGTFTPTLNPAYDSGRLEIKKTSGEYFNYNKYTVIENYGQEVISRGSYSVTNTENLYPSTALKSRDYYDEYSNNQNDNFHKYKNNTEKNAGYASMTTIVHQEKNYYYYRNHYVFKDFTNSGERIALYNANENPSLGNYYAGQYSGYKKAFDSSSSTSSGEFINLTKCDKESSTGYCYYHVSSNFGELNTTTAGASTSASYTGSNSQKENVDYSKRDKSYPASYLNHIPSDFGPNGRMCDSNNSQDVQCYILNSTSYSSKNRYEYTKHTVKYYKNPGSNIINYGQSSANSSINNYYQLGTLRGATYKNDGTFTGGIYNTDSTHNMVYSLNHFDQNNLFLTDTNLLKKIQNGYFMFEGNGSVKASAVKLNSGKTYYVAFDLTGNSGSKVTVSVKGITSKTFTVSNPGRVNFSFIANDISKELTFTINGKIGLKNISVRENSDTYTKYSEYTMSNEPTHVYYLKHKMTPKYAYYEVKPGENNGGFNLVVNMIPVAYGNTKLKDIKDLAEIHFKNPKAFNPNEVVYGYDFNKDGKIDFSSETFKGVNPSIEFMVNGTNEEFRYKFNDTYSKSLTYEKIRTIYIDFNNNSIPLNKAKVVGLGNPNLSGTSSAGSFDASNPRTYVLDSNGRKLSINSLLGQYYLTYEKYNTFASDIFFDETTHKVVKMKDNRDYYLYNQYHDENKSYNSATKTSTKLDKGFVGENHRITDLNTLANIIDNSPELKKYGYAKSENLGLVFKSEIGKTYTLTQARLKEIYESSSLNVNNFVKREADSNGNPIYTYSKNDYIITKSDVTNGYVISNTNMYALIIESKLVNSGNDRFTHGGNTYKFVIDRAEANGNPTKCYDGFTLYKEYKFGGEWVEKTKQIENYFTSKNGNYSVIDKLYTKDNDALSIYKIGNNSDSSEKLFATGDTKLFVFKNSNKNATSRKYYTNNKNDKYFYAWSSDKKVDSGAFNGYTKVKTFTINEIYKSLLLPQDIASTGLKGTTNIFTVKDTSVNENVNFNLQEAFALIGNQQNLYKLNQKTSSNLYINNIMDLSELETFDMSEAATESSKLANSKKSYKLKFSGMANYWGYLINGSNTIKSLDNKGNYALTNKVKNKTSEITIGKDIVPEFILMNKGTADFKVNNINTTQNAFDLYALTQIKQANNYFTIEEIVNDFVTVLNIIAEANNKPETNLKADKYLFQGVSLSNDYIKRLASLKTNDIMNWDENYNKLQDYLGNSSFANIVFDGQKAHQYNASVDFTEDGSYYDYYNHYLKLVMSYSLFGVLEANYTGDAFTDILAKKAINRSGYTQAVDEFFYSEDLLYRMFNEATIKMTEHDVNSKPEDPDNLTSVLDNKAVEQLGSVQLGKLGWNNWFFETDTPSGFVIDPYMKVDSFINLLLHGYNANELNEIHTQMLTGLPAFDYGSGDALTMKNEIYRTYVSTQNEDLIISNLLNYVKNHSSNNYIFVNSKNYSERIYIYQKVTSTSASPFSIIRQNKYHNLDSALDTYSGSLVNYDAVTQNVSTYSKRMINMILEKNLREGCKAKDEYFHSYFHFFGGGETDPKKYFDEYSKDKTNIADKSNLYVGTNHTFTNLTLANFLADDELYKINQLTSFDSGSREKTNYTNLTNSTFNGQKIIDENNEDTKRCIDSFSIPLHEVFYNDTYSRENWETTTVEDWRSAMTVAQANAISALLIGDYDYPLISKNVFGWFNNSDYFGFGWSGDWINISKGMTFRIGNYYENFNLNPLKKTNMPSLYADITLPWITKVTNETKNIDGYPENALDLYKRMRSDGVGQPLFVEIEEEISSLRLGLNRLFNMFGLDSEATIDLRTVNSIVHNNAGGFTENGIETNVSINKDLLKVDSNLSNDTDYDNKKTNFYINIVPNTVHISDNSFKDTINFEYSLRYTPKEANKCATSFEYIGGKCYYRSDKKPGTNILTIKDSEGIPWTLAQTYTNKDSLKINNLLQNTSYELNIRKRLNFGYLTKVTTLTFKTGNDMVRNPYGKKLSNITPVASHDYLLKNEFIPYDLQQELFGYSNESTYTFTGSDGVKYTISNKYRFHLTPNDTVAFAFGILNSKGELVKFNTTIKDAISFVGNIKNPTSDVHTETNGKTKVDFNANGLFYFELNKNDLNNYLNSGLEYEEYINKYILEKYMINLSKSLYDRLDERETYTIKAITVHDNRYIYMDYNQNDHMDNAINEPQFSFFDKNGTSIGSESTTKQLYIHRDLNAQISDISNWRNVHYKGFNSFKIASYQTSGTSAFNYYLFAYDSENGSHIVQ